MVVSRPIKAADGRLQVFEVPDTRKALQEMAAKVRSDFEGSVIGVTGSNGKTTTKEMAGNILSRRFHVHRSPGNHNNLIGLPLSILEAKKDAEWMVLEMASNAPGEISILSRIARPHWAIITNISEVHLEGFGNLLGVLKEKTSILDGIEPGGALIINGDDPSLKSTIRGSGVKFATFGLRRGNDVFPVDYSVRGDGKVSFCVEKGPRVDLPLIGFYSLQNALAAYALGLRVGLSHEEIKEGLEMPIYQSMRMEVRRENDVMFIMDCYNANPRSMYLAAETLSLMEGDGRKILVLGDMFELGEGSARLHRELGKRLSLLDLDAVVAVGELGTLVSRAIRDEDQRRGRHREVIDAMKFSEARRQLLKLLRGGDIILFKASRGVRMEKLFEMVRSRMKKGRSRR
ncbi:MAG: hypothetical protein A2Z06_00480 [Candidatus Glassbacteria bacterium RBG_16_58_8]|uniref:UDP-N-acetylmuramoyl-tripeptide--D-alanyl-D-alanine ligase n=1 Tax=Candidatus Glassbacteria bacterium RBG_16_58_8 TaxID=1817866 RepID=A0A1F5YEK9_9BACT|nr:MAG: hypothetical protein A2Z06_00480 [Candidatus Glassbacteria bacterium RBG_16_58_8]